MNQPVIWPAARITTALHRRLTDEDAPELDALAPRLRKASDIASGRPRNTYRRINGEGCHDATKRAGKAHL
jgi:hypothetical protein